MRKFITTTALASLLAIPALAETKTMTDAASSKSLYIFEVETLGAKSNSGYLASNLMGKTLYTSAADDAESIGDVNDILVSETGQVSAVIIGVGGFLGIGEKDVAVDFDRLTLSRTAEEDNTFRVTSDVTKEELEQAAAYQRPDNVPDWRTPTADVDPTTNQSMALTEAERDQWVSERKKVSADTLSADKLLGANVYDASWNDVGEIGDILMTADGKIDAAVVDIGGFLGIGEKPVAVGFEKVEIYTDDGGSLSIITPFSEEQLDAIKGYEAETYEASRDDMRLTVEN